MVKLDAPQFGEAMLLILGAECIVGSGCCENDSRANGTTDKLVLVGDEVQDGGIERGHEVG